MFTILDNLTDSVTDWVEMFQEKRGCVNFCTFVLMAQGVGASILHTTKAGVYYIILMDQCVSKLYFITVFLLGLCLMVIYVRQNFGIAERITSIMSVWCGVATLITAKLKYLFCGMKTDPPPEYGYQSRVPRRSEPATQVTTPYYKVSDE